jgi:hypothetical protein
MTAPSHGDRGIEADPGDVDEDSDGIVDDALGDPAAPEDASGSG